MGFKLYAIGKTRPHLTDRAYEFRESPTSDNWMLLERAMKAHQAAFNANEGLLRSILEELKPDEIIPRLVKLFDDVQELTEMAVVRENVRLIRSEAHELRN